MKAKTTPRRMLGWGTTTLVRITFLWLAGCLPATSGAEVGTLLHTVVSRLKRERYTGVVALAQQACAEAETPLDKAAAARFLAIALDRTGEPEAALPEFRRALSGLHSALAPGSASTVHCAAEFADALDRCGRTAEAAEVFAHTLSTVPKEFLAKKSGPAPPGLVLGYLKAAARAPGPLTAPEQELLASLKHCSRDALAWGDSSKAQLWSARVARLLERRIGARHEETMAALAELADVHEAAGDTERCCQVHETLLARDNTSTRRLAYARLLDRHGLNDRALAQAKLVDGPEAVQLQAAIQAQQGRPAEAARVLATLADDTDLTRRLACQHRVADYFRQAGKSGAAREWAERALATAEEGKRPIEAAQARALLGRLLLDAGDAGAAIGPLTAAIQAFPAADKHAEDLKIARFLAWQGERIDAESLLRTIKEAPGDAAAADVSFLLAEAYARAERLPDAAIAATAAWKRQSVLIHRRFADMTEEERFAAAAILQQRRDFLVSLALVCPEQADLLTATFDAAVRTQGITVDFYRWQREAAFLRDENLPLQRTFKALEAQRRMLATILVAGPDGDKDPDYRRCLRRARSTVARLEAELSRGASLYLRKKVAFAAGEAEVRRALRPDMVLLNFGRVSVTDFATMAQSPRYVVHILGKDKPVALLDLGPAGDIDSAIRSFRRAVTVTAPAFRGLALPERRQRPQLTLDAATVRLHRAIFAPIEPHLAGVESLCICPDGPLSLVPLEALYSETGQPFLVEERSVFYVATARTLAEGYAEILEERQLAVDSAPSLHGNAAGQFGLAPNTPLHLPRSPAVSSYRSPVPPGLGVPGHRVPGMPSIPGPGIPGIPGSHLPGVPGHGISRIPGGHVPGAPFHGASAPHGPVFGDPNVLGQGRTGGTYGSMPIPSPHSYGDVGLRGATRWVPGDSQVHRTRPKGRDMVIAGGPEYGPVVAVEPPPAGAFARMGALAFPPLDGTGREAEQLAEACRIWAHVAGDSIQLATGANAAEGYLATLESPRILHIATHGFFIGDLQSQTADPRAPLLRSGLALAGANRWLHSNRLGRRYDGILTAYEATSLRLWGTDLVVLSACETGVGEVVRSGEGVFGLRRAFRAAGARAMVMSMWKVPDDETVAFMRAFYEKWNGQTKKFAAIRHAQLTLIQALREEQRAAHPYYWAGFVYIGPVQ